MSEPLASNNLMLLFLVVVFLSGLLDGVGFKRRGLACVTWSFGLVALTGWSGRARTPARLLLGSGVFALGAAVVVVYYRRRPPSRA